MQATAIAHPIQGLVKYHGLRDPVRRIPFHDSISVCTGPLRTRTTVEVLDDGPCTASINGDAVTGRALERIETVMDAIREGAEDTRSWRITSDNDFPQFVGLGSSSSGFAALAAAGAAAYDWHPGQERLSQVARLGAGSAARALTGGVSIWRVDGERSWSECMAPADEVADWSILVPLVQHEVPTEGVHEEVVGSPLFKARVDYIPGAIEEARAAIAAGDLERLWAIAETDTLNLHAVTMTGPTGHVTWQPTTIAVMHTIRRLRDEGVPVWFSIDTGATAYLNTRPEHADAVRAAVADLDGVADVLALAPAGAATVE